ncbi:MAG: DUF2382 domain-containing protein [Waterburya sp.]
MPLSRIGDLYPNYQEDIFSGEDIKSFSVYSDNDKKIGSVKDVLVDENGRFRYLVINTGFMGLGKSVLLPVGSATIDYAQDRVYALGFTKEQAENLPEYDEDVNVDYDYEEEVRTSYRKPSATAGSNATAFDRNSYSYDRDPSLYQLQDTNHGNFKQYQDRLSGNRERFQLGDRPDNNSLYKIADLYPNYQQDVFGDDDWKGYSVYSDTEEKVGSVYDLLVDRTGNFRYFVVNTGFLGFGKKVLLPIGNASINRDRNRIYVTGFTKEQATNLPEYDDNLTVDYDYEEKVRNVYRRPAKTSERPAYTRENYSYDHEPDLYQTNEQNHQRFKLHEERLVANKHRFNTGTVTVGKRVETKTAQVSVPVDKERVVIERNAPGNSNPITPDANAFQEGEVARIDVYEESADLQKQTFVREEVEVRKEVEHDTVNLQETIRREELDIDKDSESTRSPDSDSTRRPGTDSARRPDR